MKGKLIVIEGNDGSGKTTQLNLLKEYFTSVQISYNVIDFPRYADSFYGKMVAQFLRGDYGDLKDVNPYLISVIFALDRSQATEEMKQWLQEGNIVLANRYAPSNMAHQAGRLPKEKRDAFIAWDEELEYTVHGIPREDIVIYLYVPYEMADTLLTNKDRGERSYLGDAKKDLVEKNEEYLKNAGEVYQQLAKKFPHWVTITCVDEEGNMRSKEDIHEEIKKVLKDKNIVASSM